jgi:hypothetical protein
MPELDTLISNGTNVSTGGASWSSWAWGGLSGVAESIGAIWGGIGGVQKIYEGYQKGDNKKMAVGTVMILLSAVSFMPQSWATSIGSSALGAFGTMISDLAVGLFGTAITDAVGFAAPVALGAALKKMAGDPLALNDDAVGGLFALLTSVANAYSKSASGYYKILCDAEPELRKAIPMYAFWRDKPEMTAFIKTFGAQLPAYVQGVAAYALDSAGITSTVPVGQQVVVTANRKKKKKHKRRGRR